MPDLSAPGASVRNCAATITRRSLLGGLAGAMALAASPALAAAPAILKGKGDFRRLHIVNPRTDEWLNTAYWIDGTYIPEALHAIDRILRDWREDLVHRIDPRSIDILSATHRLLESSEPFRVVSGYRCPKTNAMLRKRSRGVFRRRGLT